MPSLTKLRLESPLLLTLLSIPTMPLTLLVVKHWLARSVEVLLLDDVYEILTTLELCKSLAPLAPLTLRKSDGQTLPTLNMLLIPELPPYTGRPTVATPVAYGATKNTFTLDPEHFACPIVCLSVRCVVLLTGGPKLSMPLTRPGKCISTSSIMVGYVEDTMGPPSFERDSLVSAVLDITLVFPDILNILLKLSPPSVASIQLALLRPPNRLHSAGVGKVT